ncbi:MAG TPA: VOC family protein [Clostridia bacterium]
MKFRWCTISVNNMEESIKFYKDIVGLPIDRRFASGTGAEICFLGEGETKVELISGPDYKSHGSVEGISLGFEAASLDEMIEFIKEKGIEMKGPYQPNPHIRFIYVKDPNGVIIQFSQSM